MPFPDLIQEAAAINEDKSQVEDKKATLVVEAEAIEEMYVSWIFLFVHFDNDLSS